MKIFTMCMECQKELGHPSFEPIIADYYDDAVAYVECSRGHKSALLLQSQKFEILLESAATALLDGYTIEAASSLSAAYERFFEFAIFVFCKKNVTIDESLKETFKQVSKQSERQIGGFLFLHLITFGYHYTLNNKIPELRNKVIHQGYIPTQEEAITFGELVYQEIYSITQLIKTRLSNEMQSVIKDALKLKRAKIKEGTPCATAGAMFFSLSMVEQKKDFKEALASYKEANKIIYDSAQYMKLLSKVVSIYTKPA